MPVFTCVKPDEAFPKLGWTVLPIHLDLALSYFHVCSTNACHGALPEDGVRVIGGVKNGYVNRTKPGTIKDCMLVDGLKPYMMGIMWESRDVDTLYKCK